MPDITAVAKTAPIAMKAPARTASKKTFAGSIIALVSPTDSALRAISAGGSASSPTGVKTCSLTSEDHGRNAG